MEITSNLKSILDLLGTSIIKKDNLLYIYDGINNTMNRIERNGGKYSFSIKRDDGTYHFIYGYNGINITKDDESINFSSEGITYCRRKNNSRYNDTYIMINPLSLSFYTKDDLDGGFVENSLKVHSALDHVKKSITLQTNDTYKEDVILKRKNDKMILSHNIRQYSAKGSLINGEAFEEDLLIPVEDYVNNQLSTCEEVETALNRLDSFIPGLKEYCANSNKILNTTINEIQKSHK